MAEEMNVRRVAELARISLTPAEEVRLSGEMAEILAFARQLEAADVPPTQHMPDLCSVLRADEVRLSLDRDVILSAAPAREGEYIAVPRTVE